MAHKGFLDDIENHFGKDNYAGDQFGGARGHDGSGLPANTPGNFMFATGIECSYPTIQHGNVRRDLLRECGHYDRFKEDLGLVKEMGLNVLRYGLPYYSIHQAPGKFDWSFADEAMAELKRLKITPILDLMHFGVPDWIENYQNPELPVHFANYAGAVAKRYPWVRYYTPVNEIYVTARISAKDGVWNEQLKTDKGFVTALKHCVAASIMGNQQIAEHRPDCVIVQSESAEYTHEFSATPSPDVTMGNELRFLSLDLLYANPPSATVAMYLLDNGLTRQEYDWFMAGKPPATRSWAMITTGPTNGSNCRMARCKLPPTCWAGTRLPKPTTSGTDCRSCTPKRTTLIPMKRRNGSTNNGLIFSGCGRMAYRSWGLRGTA